MKMQATAALSKAERHKPVATVQIPAKGAFALSDRNRADLDWQNGTFKWRYRNRLQIERPVSVGPVHLAPYVSSEVFYDSVYKKWSTTAFYGGVSIPVGSKLEIEPYFKHENDTGRSPNEQVNALGLVMNLYFSVH